jgi:hypothetical protein
MLDELIGSLGKLLADFTRLRGLFAAGLAVIGMGELEN